MARLDKGFFVVDRADLATFGKDGYLLALWIKLNEWANFRPTSFKYGSNEITIERGQLLTAVLELSEELGFHRNTIKSRLDYLRDAERLVYVRKNRGILISIKNYNEKQSGVYTSTPSDTKSSSNGQIEGVHDHVHDRVHDRGMYEVIKELKNKGEGREQAPEGAASPFLNKISEEGKGEPIDEKIKPIKTNVMAPPTDSNPLAIRWLTRISEMAPNRRLSITDICAQIEQLRRVGYDDEKLSNILDELQRSVKSYRTRFISPSDGLNKYYERQLIEIAYTEFLQSEKVNPTKEVIKKEPDKSVTNTKQKIEQELLEKIKKMKEQDDDLSRN